jgi:hypothetical protein
MIAGVANVAATRWPSKASSSRRIPTCMPYSVSSASSSFGVMPSGPHAGLRSTVTMSAQGAPSGHSTRSSVRSSLVV